MSLRCACAALLVACGRVNFAPIDASDASSSSITLGVHATTTVDFATSVTIGPLDIESGSSVLLVLWGSSATRGAIASDDRGGVFVPLAPLSRESSFHTQHAWLAEIHPGGATTATISYGSADAAPQLFAVEVRGAGSVVASSDEDDTGPLFSTGPLIATAPRSIVVALDVTNEPTVERVRFASGESVLHEQPEGTRFPGALGARMVAGAGPFSVDATQSGTRGLVSMVIFPER